MVGRASAAAHPCARAWQREREIVMFGATRAGASRGNLCFRTAAGVDLCGTILTDVSYGDGHLFWGQAIIPSGERRAWVARLP